jgi:hypothetical protein
MTIRFPRRTRSNRRAAAVLLGLLVVIPLLAASLELARKSGGGNRGAGATQNPPPTTAATTTTATTATPSPISTLNASETAATAVDHVFVIVMENEESTSIIGNAKAPYINSLASQYGQATNYSAITHPSQPNYLALWSGSTQGVSDDGVYDFSSAATLADQMEQSGRTWHVAAENVPSGCFTGAKASGGSDGPGTYARKHEPAISWTSVSGNPGRCANITDFSHFDPNLGNFWLVVPNLCHDMHDCSIATGDAWLKGWLPKILTSTAFQDAVVYLTWDEGKTNVNGGGKITTIVIGPGVKPAFSSATPHNHYSLLRTIENAWGLPCIQNSCAANDLREFFR